MCDHEWYTQIEDCSGSCGWADWNETISGRHDGIFSQRCNKCNLVENWQLYSLLTDVYGYGDKKFRGKLTIEECLAVLSLICLDKNNGK